MHFSDYLVNYFDIYFLMFITVLCIENKKKLCITFRWIISFWIWIYEPLIYPPSPTDYSDPVCLWSCVPAGDKLPTFETLESSSSFRSYHRVSSKDCFFCRTWSYSHEEWTHLWSVSCWYVIDSMFLWFSLSFTYYILELLIKRFR